MNPTRYVASEISKMKVIGHCEWGEIFYQDETFRQSLDRADFTVVVEKMVLDEWRCYSTYRPFAGRKVLEKTRTKRIYPRRTV